MNKYQYASRTIFCKDQESVDDVINNEIYKLNKPENIISINITPYINPSMTNDLCVPVCLYVSYIYRYELNRY